MMRTKNRAFNEYQRLVGRLLAGQEEEEMRDKYPFVCERCGRRFSMRFGCSRCLPHMERVVFKPRKLEEQKNEV